LHPVEDQKIAIIGAGISGLRCANLLLDHGINCTLFDKSRGFGGRTSTRRKNDWRFDHGTGYFAGTNPDFLSHIAALLPWQPTGTGDRFYVGANGNNELAKNIAAQIAEQYASSLNTHLVTHLGTTITKVTRASQKGWRLTTNKGESFGPFDIVVSTAPPPQSVDIFASIASAVTQRLGGLRTYCSWALMLVTQTPLTAPDLVLEPNANISRVMAEHSKPRRQAVQTESDPAGVFVGQGQYVVQASRAFSQTHLEATPEEIIQLMLAELGALYGPIPEVVHSQAHRWLHAGIQAPLGEAYLLDRTQGIAAAGDWCTGNTAEDAFISGANLAKAIIAGG
jgi:renalase